jgi:hypothetical protein
LEIFRIRPQATPLGQYWDELMYVLDAELSVPLKVEGRPATSKFVVTTRPEGRVSVFRSLAKSYV